MVREFNLALVTVVRQVESSRKVVFDKFGMAGCYLESLDRLASLAADTLVRLIRLLSPVGGGKRFDQVFQVSAHDSRQSVQGHADAVVGHSVLREVVGAYLFRALTCSYL